MSMLNIAKRLNLTESKADTQRLINFAGEDLAKRFLEVKKRFKVPENDLNYWIKHRTVDELEQAILSIENASVARKQRADLADKGAKLVSDTEHWKVYHITTFEASQKYGRDTKWCITGVNNYGDKYWRSYTSQGIDFYFFITKHDYNPRGYDSKYAIAVYSPEQCEVFDQQDNQVTLEDIPFLDEVSIPGLELNDMNSGELYRCSECDAVISEDEANEYCTPDGEFLCSSCFDDLYYLCDYCGDVISRDDAVELPDGDMVCFDCFCDSDYLICAECGDIFARSDMRENKYGEAICQDCYECLYEAVNNKSINENLIFCKKDLTNTTDELGLSEEFKIYETMWD